MTRTRNYELNLACLLLIAGTRHDPLRLLAEEFNIHHAPRDGRLSMQERSERFRGAVTQRACEHIAEQLEKLA